MEMKNTSATNRKVLLHHLKEKKNWFLLTFVILLVTIVVLPILSDGQIEEGFLIIGLVEVFIIVFINCVIDFNYLHDVRKYGYYLTKPMNNIKRLNMTLIINTLFAAFFMSILIVISVANDFYTMEIFTVACGWLLIIIFLSGLSALLAGNSIIAGIATWFNFGLPLMMLGVIYFAMSIVSDMAIGFNVTMIMDYFIENIYRIDIIYLIEFAENPNWFIYFSLLTAICAVIYGLSLWAIKHRKNENIGQHIIFRGYKNFVALLVSLLVPFFFTQITRSGSPFTGLITFIILGSISYYVALVILEKSFKLKKSAFKLLVTFMVIFIGVVVISGTVIKSSEKILPAREEIVGVMLTNRNWFTVNDDVKPDAIRIGQAELTDDVYEDVNIYTSTESIDAVLSIHKAIIDDHTSHQYMDANFIYFMKDGSKVKRYFSLKFVEEVNENLVEKLRLLENTNEYKKEMMPFLYDNQYASTFIGGTLNINQNEVSSKLMMNEEFLTLFREALLKDAAIILSTKSNNIYAVLSGYGYYLSDKSSAIDNKEPSNGYVNLRIYSNNGKEWYLDITHGFTYTRDFLSNYIN